MINAKQILQSQKKRIFPILFWAIFISIILFLLFYRLNNWPTLLWDDGWTLSAVRNWIEHGHLGNYLIGLPIPPRIPLRFPVAIPVALSMRILGVGTWQGRLPNVIFTIFALGLYVYIITKMYNPRIGAAALILMLCLSPSVFHPIIMGRQLLAEMPMMFYLLGGYTMVWLVLTRSPIWSVGAVLLFGIAIHAKLQVPPFWLASIVLAIWMSAIYRQWRSVKILTGVAVGSVLVAILVFLAQNLIMPGSFDDPALIKILFNTSVIVLEWTARRQALYIIIIFALPELVGLIWAGLPILKSLLTHKGANNAEVGPHEINQRILRAAIWGLGASWFVWFSALSVSWIRYLFPAYFIGIIFVSAYLSELTNEYDLRLITRRTFAIIFKRKYDRQGFQTLALIIVFAAALGFAIGSMRIGLAPSGIDPEAASTYLSDNIPANALVETFESELFYLTPELKYHFPSDLVSMQLLRRITFDPQYPIDYDPLKANPDYIVVGPFAGSLHLYDDKLLQERFQLEADVSGYQIYHKKDSQGGK